MTGATYQVKFHSATGELLQVWPIGATSEVSCVLTQNTVGTLTVTVPRGAMWWSAFSPDRILILERNTGSGYYALEDQAFFLVDWEFGKDDNNGEMVTLYGVSGNDLLDRRIVAYPAGDAYAGGTDQADDLIKSIVLRNLGANCTDTSRVLNNLSVAAYLQLGPSVTASFTRKNVLTTVQGICKQSEEAGTPLYFDTIMNVPGGFEFRTWTGQRGVDHGAGSGDPRIVTPSRARVRETHSEEKNFVYCGGGGIEANRIVKTSTVSAWVNASPWNRRERWVDARNGGTTDAYIQGQADAALYENRPRITMEGVLTGAEGLTYGVDYRFGDIIACTAFGLTFDCHVNTINLRYAGGQEQLQIAVKGG